MKIGRINPQNIPAQKIGRTRTLAGGNSVIISMGPASSRPVKYMIEVTVNNPTNKTRDCNQHLGAGTQPESLFFPLICFQEAI